MLTVEQKLGQKMMVAFAGKEAAAVILARIAQNHLGGITLFRHENVENPAQIRQLTSRLQQAAAEAGQPPLLIAADQETGQLMGLGDGFTLFPGNMALGATRDPQLAYQMGLAVGRELTAVGVNLNYAPVCDINSNPANPNIGIRAFGDDPTLASQMAVQLIRGLQEAGVAATAKHFPGLGEGAVDSHHELPILDLSWERFKQVELPSFQAAINAGVKLMMTAHVGIEAITGQADLPATLSRQALHKLLRQTLGFEGVIISDAMDMHAIAQGDGQVIDAIAAIGAGVDLLLMTGDEGVNARVFAGLHQAARRQVLDTAVLTASVQRILALKQWLAQQPAASLDVVNCAAHQTLAAQISGQAITLVRDTANLLPLTLAPEANILLLLPQPQDLTPADTSSYVKHSLGSALRRYHGKVEEISYPQSPTAVEQQTTLAQIRQHLRPDSLIILGTISAHLHPAQAELAQAILQLGQPTITVALRTPYDLTAYPSAQTHLCTYGFYEPSMVALAARLWGKEPFTGQLPVKLAG
jgi:beta-N-acetylhexosaminidase